MLLYVGLHQISGLLLLGVFFFLCVELEVVCCTLGCIRYRGLRQIVEPCWSQVAPALLIALHKCFDAQPDPGDVSPAGVGVQMQEVEEEEEIYFIFYLYKHRKNCECCPGHYMSTSVY